MTGVLEPERETSAVTDTLDGALDPGPSRRVTAGDRVLPRGEMDSAAASRRARQEPRESSATSSPPTMAWGIGAITSSAPGARHPQRVSVVHVHRDARSASHGPDPGDRRDARRLNVTVVTSLALPNVTFAQSASLSCRNCYRWARVRPCDDHGWKRACCEQFGRFADSPKHRMASQAPSRSCASGCATRTGRSQPSA